MNRVCNPLLNPRYHFADPEAHCIDGKLYIYGSCDENRDGYCSDKYYVVYSDDFETFNVSDISFATSEVDWGDNAKVHSSLSNITTFEQLPEHIKKQLPEDAKSIPIKEIVKSIEMFSVKNLPKDKLLYAPDGIKVKDKNVLFFCMSDDSEGVAFADKMEGPFKNPVRIKIEDGDYVEGIDPAVFLDDDGRCYYYWGQFSANAGELSERMTEIKKDSFIPNIISEETHYFHEGSSMRKRNGIYYFVYASVVRGKPSCLSYSTSKSPLGPFKYKGVIVDNDGSDSKVWNNHGSIECINDKWFVFYHRSSEHCSSMRQICAEPICFDENGDIYESKMTSQGMGTPFQLNEEVFAYTACQISGDGYTKNENFILPMGSSKVCYRYFSFDKAGKNITLSGTGKADVSVHLRKVASIDEDRFNKSKIQNDEILVSDSTSFNDGAIIRMNILPGEYELILNLENANGLTILKILIGE